MSDSRAVANSQDVRRVRLGIDTGGTFTDVIAFDQDSGVIHATKTPSTPDDPSRAFLAGVDQILEQAGLSASDLDTVSHGTTVATNALLEDEISGLGFLTTMGFRHVLEIARQSVPDGYGNSYFWVKPDRIVPLHLVREVDGRLDAEGAEIRSLDEEAVADAAAWFRDQGVGVVGICFLHSYVNSGHEEQARRIFYDVYPECTLSISSDVLREYREYERSVTTLVDAFVKRTVVDYVQSIEDRLHDLRPTGDEKNGNSRLPFYVMKSNGGVVSAHGVAARPITTILSGPAAGALGAAHLAEAAGFPQVLALDGGGTSTDVTVVRNGRATLTTEGRVGRFPAKVPMIDIVTVGTGGGSIAWSPPEGGLKVGPRSAGADPGPLCYVKGGTEPTLTDAHLVLGRIPPHLLGGRLPLDVDAAHDGVARLASEVGMKIDACAEGIVEIAVWNQANAIRQVSVRKGLDVRDFALCAFGGSGALQACRLLDVLNLEAVVVPRDPGNVSAFGLLTVDVRNDEVQTFVVRHEQVDLSQVAAAFSQLEEKARASLDAEGIEASAQRIERSADLRYDGQAFEVRADAPDGAIDGTFCEAVVGAFHDAHEALYDYSYRDRPDQSVEWVNLRVTGVGAIKRPELVELDPIGSPTSSERHRQVVFDGQRSDTLILDRAALAPGNMVAGPAIIEEFGSTTPVLPGFGATIDALGNVIIRQDASS